MQVRLIYMGLLFPVSVMFVDKECNWKTNKYAFLVWMACGDYLYFARFDSLFVAVNGPTLI